MELPEAEEQQEFAMLKAGHPHISTAEIFRVMADPVNRIPPLTQQNLLVNCMSQLQRMEKSSCCCYRNPCFYRVSHCGDSSYAPAYINSSRFPYCGGYHEVFQWIFYDLGLSCTTISRARSRPRS